MQGGRKKSDQLAEVIGASEITLFDDELEIISSILHRIWDMEESTRDSDSWLGEILFHVEEGEVDPNDLPDVIRNLKKNLDSLPDEYCTFDLDGKTGDIQNVRIGPLKK